MLGLDSSSTNQGLRPRRKLRRLCALDSLALGESARLGTGREKKGKGNVNAGKFETAVEVSWVLELGRGDSKPVGLWALFS